MKKSRVSYKKPAIVSKDIKINSFNLNSRFYNSFNNFQTQNDLIPQVYASGSGSCFITTAVCDVLGLKDDNPIMNTLRQFRDTYMTTVNNGKEELGIYYEIFPKIIDIINARSDRKEIYKQVAKDTIIPAYNLIQRNRLEDAHEIYKQTCVRLIKTYL